MRQKERRGTAAGWRRSPDLLDEIWHRRVVIQKEDLGGRCSNRYLRRVPERTIELRLLPRKGAHTSWLGVARVLGQQHEEIVLGEHEIVIR